VDTFDEIAQALANLADWTAPGGRCFLPVADPDLIARTALPDRLPYGPTGEAGEVRIEGIVWTFLRSTSSSAVDRRSWPAASVRACSERR
jgi:hypothetical protein